MPEKPGPMLFDKFIRRRKVGKRWAEPHFTFLNQSDDSIEHRVRSLLTEWFMQIPEFSKPDVAGRFRSTDHGQHLGALNELFLHAIFRNLGYRVDIMPPGPNNKTNPDFALSSDRFTDFDLEATVAEVSREERSRRNRAAIFYESVDQIQSRNFEIFVES